MRTLSTLISIAVLSTAVASGAWSKSAQVDDGRVLLAMNDQIVMVDDETEIIRRFDVHHEADITLNGWPAVLLDITTGDLATVTVEDGKAVTVAAITAPNKSAIDQKLAIRE